MHLSVKTCTYTLYYLHLFLFFWFCFNLSIEAGWGGGAVKFPFREATKLTSNLPNEDDSDSKFDYDFYVENIEVSKCSSTALTTEWRCLLYDSHRSAGPWRPQPT